MKQKFVFALIALLAAFFALTGCEGDAMKSDYTEVDHYVNEPDVETPDMPDLPDEEEEEEEEEEEGETSSGTVYCEIEQAGDYYCISSLDTPALTASACTMAGGDLVSSCD